MTCSWRVHREETLTSTCYEFRSDQPDGRLCSLKFDSAAQTRPKPAVPAASLRPERSCFRARCGASLVTPISSDTLTKPSLM